MGSGGARGAHAVVDFLNRCGGGGILPCVQLRGALSRRFLHVFKPGFDVSSGEKRAVEGRVIALEQQGPLLPVLLKEDGGRQGMQEAFEARESAAGSSRHADYPRIYAV